MLVFCLVAVVVITWFETIIVFNGFKNQYVSVVKDRFNKRLKFVRQPFSFKLPYPLQTVDAKIKLYSQQFKRYVSLDEDGMEFVLKYQVISPEKFYPILHELDEYLLELVSNLIMKDIYVIEDKQKLEVFIREKLISVLKNHGIKVNVFILIVPTR